MMPAVAVLGATGFVGSHIVRALTQRGVLVQPVTAPRVTARLSTTQRAALIDRLRDQLNGNRAVINAAGVAEAVASSQVLTDANHLMPALLAEATSSLPLRLVHVSSAAVQGRRPVLDSSREHAPFSPYSVSKAEGESALLDTGGDICVYRPPGVHGRTRRVTHTLVRVASSPLASVASPGTANTPQALAQNVADAVAFLATSDTPPPRIVHHPSEGLTTQGLLNALGGRSPRRVPQPLARSALRALYLGARARSGLEGQARRLEVLWFGQDQAPSWLNEKGWEPPYRIDRWEELGRQVREDIPKNTNTHVDGSFG